jgi:ATP-dependent helicase HrpA
MAAELVETSRLFARYVAKIDVDWIEKIAEKLCKRTYADEHWEKRLAQVIAYEQVSLYGLIIVVKRKVDYSAIDVQRSRELFILEALVKQDFYTNKKFFDANNKLIIEIQDLENKARRPDILITEQDIYDFYNQYIPDYVCSGKTFEKWYKKDSLTNKTLLYLTRADLMQHDAQNVTNEAFPDIVQIDDIYLNYTYHFDPAHECDGVNLQIPVYYLNRLKAERFEWLVSGLLCEKIAALLRSLPKKIRKSFVPVPDFAQAAYEALKITDEPLIKALSDYFHRICGVFISLDNWQIDNIPIHLQMNFVVIDENGKNLAHGRDLNKLQQQFTKYSKTYLKEVKHELTQENLTTWNFGELPEKTSLNINKKNGSNIQGFPALIDKETHVDLQIFVDKQEALQQHYQGLRRLFLLNLSPNLKTLHKKIPIDGQICLKYAALGTCNELKSDLIFALIDIIFLINPLPNHDDEFNQRLENGKAKLFAEAAKYSLIIKNILTEYHNVKRKIKGNNSLTHLKIIKEIETHLQSLIYSGFVKDIKLDKLQHLPRYLKAISIRLQKLNYNPDKDIQKYMEIKELWQKYLNNTKNKCENLQEFRWMLEEFRVSLFAQELKTIYPVSKKRLEKAWQEI